MKCAWLVLFLCGGASWAAASEILNGKQPQGAPQTLIFTEDLVFGSEEEDDVFLWPDLKTRVSVDRRGHMYVCDPAANRILEFDPTGAYVKTLATQGQGPGEYQELHGFQILADGSGLGVEIRGGAPVFKFYDSELNFKDQKSIGDRTRIILSLQSGPFGRRFGANFIAMDQAAGTMTLNTGILGDEFQVLRTLTSDPRPMPNPARFMEGDFWAEFIGANLKKFFGGIGLYAFDGKGVLYTAVGSRYEITRWSEDLKSPGLIIKKEYQPIPLPELELAALLQGIRDQIPDNEAIAKVITPAVLKKAIQLAEPPPFKTPVFGIVPMEDGKLLVVHDVNLVEGRNTADIFSKTGEFLGQTSLENNGFVTYFLGGFHPQMTFRNGMAYTVQTTPLGDKKVARYRYELKSQ